MIEFVPKSDPMIQRMLLLREDIFEDYRYDSFRRRIADQAKIVRETEVSATGRTLIWYDRSSG